MLTISACLASVASALSARYGQGSATARGPVQGLGSKVKRALETAIRLAPEPAAARIALGSAPLW